MRKVPEIAVCILLLLGISGCAGAPQRLSWSSSPAETSDRSSSPASGLFSWWHRPGSQRSSSSGSAASVDSQSVDARGAAPAVAESNRSGSQADDSKPPQDLWPDRRSTGLARLFPFLNRRWNTSDGRRDASDGSNGSQSGRLSARSPSASASEDDSDGAPVRTAGYDTRRAGEDQSTLSRSEWYSTRQAYARARAKERLQGLPGTMDNAQLKKSRPATRFRDVQPERVENRATPEPGSTLDEESPTSKEDGVSRASLAAREPAESERAMVTLERQPTVDRGDSADAGQSALVPALEAAPVPASALVAMNRIDDPASLLPPSLALEPVGPSDAQDEPRSTPAQEAPAAKSGSSSSSENSKASSKGEASSPAPPPGSRAPAPPSPDGAPRRSEQRKSDTQTKPAPDESKTQRPQPGLEPAPAPPIRPAPSPARESELETPNAVISPPSPPPAQGPEQTPAPASAQAPAASGALELEATTTAAPPATSSAPAGYGYGAPPTAAVPAPQDFLSPPSLGSYGKALPTAQWPAPLFPPSYAASPQSAYQVLPAPQTACVPCASPMQTCDCRPCRYKTLLCAKWKRLMQCIHDHCPLKNLKQKFYDRCSFKRAAAVGCCQGCACCRTGFPGVFPSPQVFFASPQSGWLSVQGGGQVPAGSPPMVASSALPARPDAGPGSVSTPAPDRSTGAETGDVTQGGKGTDGVAPDDLDEAP
jgi:hypothetical protein